MHVLGLFHLEPARSLRSMIMYVFWIIFIYHFVIINRRDIFIYNWRVGQNYKSRVNTDFKIIY